MKCVIDSSAVSFVNNGMLNPDNFCFNGICLKMENHGSQSALTRQIETDAFALYALFQSDRDEYSNVYSHALASFSRAFLKNNRDKSNKPVSFLNAYANAVKKYFSEKTEAKRFDVALILFFDDKFYYVNFGDTCIFRYSANNIVDLSDNSADAFSYSNSKKSGFTVQGGTLYKGDKIIVASSDLLPLSDAPFFPETVENATTAELLTVSLAGKAMDMGAACSTVMTFNVIDGPTLIPEDKISQRATKKQELYNQAFADDFDSTAASNNRRNNKSKKAPIIALCCVCALIITGFVCFALFKRSSNNKQTEQTAQQTTQAVQQDTIQPQTDIYGYSTDTAWSEQAEIGQDETYDASVESQIEEYINNDSQANISTTNGITYVNGIMIANKTYPLPSSYNPGGISSEAQSAFNKMASDAASSGISLNIVSGFRSYEYQSTLYERYASRDGYAAADRYSARPGYSEHQTGLCMDVNSTDQSFAYTAEGKWLAANCSKYGFIIRYPDGKESQTGYMYEPWHIRYLGVDTATAVTNSGLCLEEYLGITSQYQN